MTTATAIPTFAADGRRLLADDGTPTKAGRIEIQVAEIVGRGATEEHARFLAAAKITRSSKGTAANNVNGTAAAFSARECELLGIEAGPGNN